jgi:transcriptional regulator with XRE-family HTH domain
MKKSCFDKQLKKLIADKGITLRALSRATAVPQSTLSSYLAGGAPAKPEHILALSEYFSVTMEFLLFNKKSKSPTLEELLTEDVFEGWLRVKIERAIPNKRKFDNED